MAHKRMCNIPQGHDCRCQGDTRDGVEVGKVRQHKVNRGKNHDEIGKFYGLAGTADGVMELLQ